MGGVYSFLTVFSKSIPITLLSWKLLVLEDYRMFGCSWEVNAIYQEHGDTTKIKKNSKHMEIGIIEKELTRK